MSDNLMRSNVLVLVSLLFTFAGTACLGLGVAVLIDNARDTADLSEWVGTSLGLAILSTTALWLFMLGVLCYIAALLAYIANTIANAVERTPTTPSRSVPILPEQPRQPWYTETQSK